MLTRSPLVTGGKAAEALPLADAMLERIGTWNRRTLDPFAERGYFYASWAYEKVLYLHILTFIVCVCVSMDGCIVYMSS